MIVVPSSAFADDWQTLEPLPDREGFAGSYAGVSHAALLVAGGANFPYKKPAERGTKVWYDHDSRQARWTDQGEIPTPRVTLPCVRWNEAWDVDQRFHGRMRR